MVAYIHYASIVVVAFTYKYICDKGESITSGYDEAQPAHTTYVVAHHYHNIPANQVRYRTQPTLEAAPTKPTSPLPITYHLHHHHPTNLQYTHILVILCIYSGSCIKRYS